MSDVMMMVGERTSAQKTNSVAAFLLAHFTDLSEPEANVVAQRLKDCANEIERLSRENEVLHAALIEIAEAKHAAPERLREMAKLAAEARVI